MTWCQILFWPAMGVIVGCAWVGLTDEEVRLASKTVAEDGLGSEGCVDRFAYAIEAKLKEKNT